MGLALDRMGLHVMGYLALARNLTGHTPVGLCSPCQQ